MADRWNWRVAARCRTTDAEGLFLTGARQREARVFCRPCPVRTECLAHALDHRIEFGVWGGATERERRALLRARPQVRSWAELLLRARSAHLAAAGGRPPVPAPRNPDDGRRREEDRCDRGVLRGRVRDADGALRPEQGRRSRRAADAARGAGR